MLLFSDLTYFSATILPVEESSQLGLEINWSKTKLQVFDDNTSPPSKVSVLGHDVEVVDSFVYLGSCIDTAGGSEHDACRRIELSRTCMKALYRNIYQFADQGPTLQCLHTPDSLICRRHVEYDSGY